MTQLVICQNLLTKVDEPVGPGREMRFYTPAHPPCPVTSADGQGGGHINAESDLHFLGDM